MCAVQITLIDRLNSCKVAKLSASIRVPGSKLKALSLVSKSDEENGNKVLHSPNEILQQ